MTSPSGHAWRELALAGEPDGFAATVTAAVAVLERLAPGEMRYAAGLVRALVEFEPLTPLTCDPQEWQPLRRSGGEVEVWQSTRCPRAVSVDGGRTFEVLDDGSSRVFVAATPPWWMEPLMVRHGLSEAQALEVAQTYLDMGPMTEFDRERLDAMPADRRSGWMLDRWRRGAWVAGLLYQPPESPDPGGV